MEIRSNAYDPARRPYPQADITRPNRETIDRGTPKPAGPEDVRARQREAAAERAEQTQEQRDLSKRAQAARQQAMADRISNVRHKKRRIQAAREQIVGDRVENARHKATRAHSAREQVQEVLAQRIQNARENLPSEGPAAERAGGVSADRLSLSDTTLRLQAADAEGGDDKRAERVTQMREMYKAGTLNTRELIARAAHLLLSGD